MCKGSILQFSVIDFLCSCYTFSPLSKVCFNDINVQLSLLLKGTVVAPPDKFGNNSLLLGWLCILISDRLILIHSSPLYVRLISIVNWYIFAWVHLYLMHNELIKFHKA